MTATDAAKKAARRIASPLIERIRPVIAGASEQRAASAQAQVAALEILIGELRRDVAELTQRVTELESPQ